MAGAIFIFLILKLLGLTNFLTQQWASSVQVLFTFLIKQIRNQSGAELGQAHLKLELDFTLFFFRFGLIELTGWHSCS